MSIHISSLLPLARRYSAVKPVSESRHYRNHRGLPVAVQKLLALAALVVLSPLLLTVALMIRLESHGAILFSQTRVGENGRHFKMYKFRSMYLKDDLRYKEPIASDSDRSGVCKKFYRDTRVTQVGRIIRKFSIDELPQLWNVLSGDMCLVGPRPALAEEMYQYSFDEHQRVYRKPGLTGLWQVSGRADLSFSQQVDLDKTYMRNQSIWLDTKILFATVPAVLLAKGAY